MKTFFRNLFGYSPRMLTPDEKYISDLKDLRRTTRKNKRTRIYSGNAFLEQIIYAVRDTHRLAILDDKLSRDMVEMMESVHNHVEKTGEWEELYFLSTEAFCNFFIQRMERKIKRRK